MAQDEFAHSSPDALQREVAAVSGSESPPGGVRYGKAEVNYRPAGSSNTRCERCSHFSWTQDGRGRGSCDLVAGLIAPDAVCDKYSSGSSGLLDLVTGERTT